jgi:hypothetical protein
MLHRHAHDDSERLNSSVESKLNKVHLSLMTAWRSLVFFSSLFNNGNTGKHSDKT